MELKIIQGNVFEAIKKIPDESIDVIVTSPPYWGLRFYNTPPIVISRDDNCKHEWVDYKHFIKQITDGIGSNFNTVTKAAKQENNTYGNAKVCIKCKSFLGHYGIEPNLDLYIENTLLLTNELKRVLKPTGLLFWNHGNSYGSKYQGVTRLFSDKTSLNANKYKHYMYYKPKYGKPKSLTMQNYRLVLKMLDEQKWILRNIIIWNKPNGKPESVTDRFTRSYEPIFMFSKSQKYYFNQDELTKTGSHTRDIWSINTAQLKDFHIAPFPEELVKKILKHSCPPNGVVLDPFLGSGTTMKVARQLGLNCIGIELNPEYVNIAKKRVNWNTGLGVNFEFVVI